MGLHILIKTAIISSLFYIIFAELSKEIDGFCNSLLDTVFVVLRTISFMVFLASSIWAIIIF